MVLPENAVLAIILGMCIDPWCMELSETTHVRKNDSTCLTEFASEVHVTYA